MPKQNRQTAGIHFDYHRRKSGLLAIYAMGPVVERLHGKPKVRVPVRTKVLALRWAQEQIKLDELRRSGMALPVTLSEAAEDYAVDLEHQGYAANTRVGYLWAAREWVRVLGGHVQTTQIRKADLYTLKRTVTGAPATKRTKWRRLGRFAHELREQGLTPNLTSDMIRDCFTPRRGPVVEKTRPRCLSVDEVAAMLSATDHPLPRFLLLTGCRIREALAITWEMVDMQAREIQLPARITKTKRPREIRLRWRPSIEDWLHDALRTHDLVFGGETYDSVRKLLSYHCGTRKAQVNGPLRDAVPGLNWKDLRSTCASYLHSLNINASHMDRAKDLGHSVVMAERVYVDRVRVSEGADTLESAMGLAPRQTRRPGGPTRLK